MIDKNKKAQIEKWIVWIIIGLIGFAIIVAIALGWLGKGFNLSLGQLKPPSLPK